MKRYRSFILKEFQHVFRDGRTLLMLFGLPVIMITLFGFALTNEIKNAGVVIYDLDQNESSAGLIKMIASNPVFRIDHFANKHDDIDRAFRTGKVRLAIVIPENFSNDLYHLNHATIQIIADASDPNTATALTGFIRLIASRYQSEKNKLNLNFAGISPEIRMIYNPELKGATNFVPGIMALVLLLICVLMTSVSIVKEKEKGTMEVLLASPSNPFLIIVSKAIPYFILSIINLTVILIMGVYALEMPFNGSLLLFYCVSALYIITALSLGLLISNITNSQQAAMLISLMGMLIPSLLFTGFLFPIESMPIPLRIIANIVPSRWYYNIVKSIMIKGVGINSIIKEVAVLLSMTVLFLVVSLKKFKIRLQ